MTEERFNQLLRLQEEWVNQNLEQARRFLKDKKLEQLLVQSLLISNGIPGSEIMEFQKMCKAKMLSALFRLSMEDPDF